VEVPPGKVKSHRPAASVASVRVTARAKRTQPGCGPRDGAPKTPLSWRPTPLHWWKATGGGRRGLRPSASAGVEERGTHPTGLLGTWEVLTPPCRVRERDPGEQAQAVDGERSPLHGANRERDTVPPPEATRAAGWVSGSRSPPLYRGSRGTRPRGPGGGKGGPTHGTERKER
jgi:hypothetical protein